MRRSTGFLLSARGRSETVDHVVYKDTRKTLGITPSREDSRPLLSALSLCESVTGKTPRSVFLLFGLLRQAALSCGPEWTRRPKDQGTATPPHAPPPAKTTTNTDERRQPTRQTTSTAPLLASTLRPGQRGKTHTSCGTKPCHNRCDAKRSWTKLQSCRGPKGSQSHCTER